MLISCKKDGILLEFCLVMHSDTIKVLDEYFVVAYTLFMSSFRRDVAPAVQNFVLGKGKVAVMF